MTPLRPSMARRQWLSPASGRAGRKLEVSRRRVPRQGSVQQASSPADSARAFRAANVGTLVTLSGLLPVITADPDLQLALDQAKQTPALGGDLVAPAALRPLLVSALAGTGQPRAGVTVAVTATAREAEELAAALGSLLGPDSVGYFPAWETLPHERLSPRPDTSGQRLAVLRRLARPTVRSAAGTGDAGTQPAAAHGERPGRAGAGQAGSGRVGQPGRHRDPASRHRLRASGHGRAPRRAGGSRRPPRRVPSD